VDIRSFVSIVDLEAALGLVPSTGARGRAGTPAVVLVARTPSDASARTALAALEAPIDQLFPAPSSGPGQVPVIADRQVAGVTAHQLTLAPGLQVSYSVFHGLVVLATGLGGIASVVRHVHSLSGDSTYKAAVRDPPQLVTSLLFLDFSQLLNFVGQTRLVQAARWRALRPSLEKVRAVGLHSTKGEADTTAELYFKIP